VDFRLAPEWRHRVTVRHFTDTHFGAAGVQGILAYIEGQAGHAEQNFCRALEYEPGTKMIYSDLGIILLAEIIHRLTGKALDVLTHDNIFSPLGMNHSMYLPPKKIWPTIAPTEIDNQLRHRLIQGEVHDENAFAIGGVPAMRDF